MSTEIRFAAASDALAAADHWHFIGTVSALTALGEEAGRAFPEALLPLWPHLLEGLSPTEGAASHATLLVLPPASPEAAPRTVRIQVLALPATASRHNAPSRADALLAATRGRFLRGVHAAILVPEPALSADHLEAWVLATSLALARADPSHRRRRP